MPKKYTIKDIALLSGVSTGTVDRVLHNRGDVSQESKQKVEKVLREIKYSKKKHFYISNKIEDSKQISLLMILPQSSSIDDYWSLIKQGMDESIQDFANTNLKIKFLYYNQFDIYSCRNVFNEALKLKFDGVIIGPSFNDETVVFTNHLFVNNIPYIYVDTHVANTKPIASYGPHSYQTGAVQAKLLNIVLEKNKDIAVFQSKRIGDEASITSSSRMYGFMSYIKKHSPNIKTFLAQYDYADKTLCWESLDHFFLEHKSIGGAVVFNTRGYIISEYLKEHKLDNIKLIGYGTDKRNIDGLKNGYFSFIISERPFYQGYKSVRTMLEYLLFNKTVKENTFTPIDILIKETVDFYTIKTN